MPDQPDKGTPGLHVWTPDFPCPCGSPADCPATPLTSLRPSDLPSRDHYWMEDAERVHSGNYIGECDNGDLWVWQPGPEYMELLLGRWVRFNRRNLRHRFVYWRSKRARRVVWLEAS